MNATLKTPPKRNRPFVIAELSGNHNRSKGLALELVRAAAKAGASAIKLQTYTPDCLTIRGAFTITEPSSPWLGRELYDLYEEANTPWEWHRDLFEASREEGIPCFSTPFSTKAVEFLETLNNPIYKIASFEINHIPLLQCVAQTGKPVIMSTGGSTVSDIDEAVNTLRKNGCQDLTLLKCTSAYPADPKEINLRTISHMAAVFGCDVGISDHTLGIGVSVASIAFGVTCIEKHLTLSRADGGVDSSFSLEPQEFAQLVTESNRAFDSLGRVFYGLEEAEGKVSAGKRSIYAACNIAPGDVFTEENLRVIRPGYGLHPRHFFGLLGQRAEREIAIGQPLSLQDIKQSTT
jgi:N-acetylneuraminate synthase